MSKDISDILRDWDYEPDEVSVRIVRGDDGQDRIQLRLDLGLLQMELDGRPDGKRPEDCESWLDHYEARQQAHDEARPDRAAYVLDDDACLRLWAEGVQYYHRYLSLWHLEMYEPCARDTARNLRLFAFVRAHAENDRQKFQFDQWRPYVLMMNARAVATPIVQRMEFDLSLATIDAAIDAVRDFLDEYGQSDRADECVELLSLEQWREEVAELAQEAADAKPKTELETLRAKLRAAVEAEEFEVAAELRDQIRAHGPNG